MREIKLKVVYVLMLFIVGLLATSVAYAADVPVQIQKVYVNGAEFDITGGEIRGDIERADSIEVEVKLLATGNDEHVSVEAEVRGLEYDREKASDQTPEFTIKDGRSYYKILRLDLPDRMDSDQYALRIEVGNRKDDEAVENLILDVGSVRHGIKIKDVVFSPVEIQAGRTLITNVRLKNIGEYDEEDVKVIVELPELGISQADYIDDVEADDSVTSEPIWMRIPAQAEAGEYTVVVTVEYNEGDDKVSAEYEVTVVSDVAGSVLAESVGKTIINVGSEVQNVIAGESGVIYPVSLTNGGLTSRTYTISVNVGDWADIRVSPNVVVLEAGETKIVYVYVAAREEASQGEQTFGVEIKSGDELLKEVVLKANVTKSVSESGFKKALEIVLVVLVVLLFVIGLIIGFSRLRGNEEEDIEEEQKEDEQSYY